MINATHLKHTLIMHANMLDLIKNDQICLAQCIFGLLYLIILAVNLHLTAKNNLQKTVSYSTLTHTKLKKETKFTQ